MCKGSQAITQEAATDGLLKMLGQLSAWSGSASDEYVALMKSLGFQATVSLSLNQV